jgi:uncharacterized coiled-coil protein SlyX
MEEAFRVRIRSSDLQSVTGSVRGYIQAFIRRLQKYQNAHFEVDRKAGIVEVEGVPREVLQDALDRARGVLTRNKAFTYEIEAVPEGARLGSEKIPESASTGKRMDVDSLVRAHRRELDEQAQGYEAYTTRLQSDLSKLEKEKASSDEARRSLSEQLKERSEELATSRATCAELQDRVRSLETQVIAEPAIAVGKYVAYWNTDAERISEEVVAVLRSPGFVRKLGLIAARIDQNLVTEAARILQGTGSKVDSEEEIRKLAGQSESTSDLRNLPQRDSYEEAKRELEYLDGIQSGSIQVPPSVKEVVLKNVDPEARRRIITEFENGMNALEARRKIATDLTNLIGEFDAAKSLAKVAASWEAQPPIPIWILQADHGTYQIVYPGKLDHPVFEELTDSVLTEAFTNAGCFRNRVDKGTATVVFASVEKPDADVPTKTLRALRLGLAAGFRRTIHARLGLRLGVAEVRVREVSQRALTSQDA